MPTASLASNAGIGSSGKRPSSNENVEDPIHPRVHAPEKRNAPAVVDELGALHSEWCAVGGALSTRRNALCRCVVRGPAAHDEKEESHRKLAHRGIFQDLGGVGPTPGFSPTVSAVMAESERDRHEPHSRQHLGTVTSVIVPEAPTVGADRFEYADP